MSTRADAKIERLRIEVNGIVQGVGFRPFVFGLARNLSLSGFVLNDSAGVTVEVEGKRRAVELFQERLVAELPPLARIDSMATSWLPVRGDSTFLISQSEQDEDRTALISPDVTTCEECLRELLEPSDRRYGYPFINCTNCGPRFTIVRDVPYDRGNTTMRAFVMCPQCRTEYEDPLSRRFHAQPNACPVCGPRVRLLAATDAYLAIVDAVTVAAQRLSAGAILAIKGLGGYHLTCDALNEPAVAGLRARKHREARPFALMVRDAETARQLCDVSTEEVELLQSRRRPIVLLRRASPSPVASSVAPGVSTLGLMLPYTPLHHLLLDAFEAVVEPGRQAALVMTSGNRIDEPIAYRDEDALTRLSLIAEGILTHNREINTRCDDSVARIAVGGEQMLRRSRGYAPEPLPLPVGCAIPLLACGGHLKNTFALCRGKQAFVSHHIGDLENLGTLTSFREGIEHYQHLFDIHPQAVAYDLHPEYLATKYALDLEVEHKLGVQHHHAHIASVLAEHGIEEPVIGVAADGTGYGEDGAIWGCEIMVADLHGYRRASHLAYVPLPGGEQAVRQPWRMAAVYLERAYGEAFQELDIPFVRSLDLLKWRPISQMAARGINSPRTSSLGRLFDAVAALLRVRMEALYEGQAAVELEVLAEQDERVREVTQPAGVYPFSIVVPIGGGLPVLDVSPTIRAMVEDIQKGVAPSLIALLFHCTVAEMLAFACGQVQKDTGLDAVALSGGVFQNRLLLEQLVARLKGAAFRVYLNRRVPPNDGGLSYGQAAVAAARMSAA